LRKVAFAVLVVCLVVSLFFNGYLYYQLTSKHSPTFFSFVFDSTMQKLVNGTLYLNLTFEVVEGNLTVKAEVNAESYNRYAALALQFDSDNNGTIDIRYWPEDDIYVYQFFRDDSQFLLRANNMTRRSWDSYWGWLPDGEIYTCSIFSGFFEQKSPFHTCSYKEGVYTFYFTFPVKPTEFNFDIRINSTLTPTEYSWLDGEHGIQGKLVRVLYGIVPFSGEPERGRAVYVPPFRFIE